VSRFLKAVLAAVAVLLCATGCVTLPSSGPVRTEPVGEQQEDEAPVDFTPGGPERGAAPVEVVRGFLTAMQATPLNTSVARQFLSTESSTAWVPERGTVVYSTDSITAQGKNVVLGLSDTVRLDDRGAWLGASGDATYTMDMVREGREWRIDAPPDRLLIPTDHFETRFQQFNLHFFDKSAQLLVPEPVYVPTGAQATTFLVTGMLRGPEPDLLGVERTFLPARTRLDDISVPVTPDGTAEVPLSDEILDLGNEQLTRAFAQLAWTLRQVSGVTHLRVTVDGSPLEAPGLGPDVDVDAFPEFDPAVSWASQSLFGIRDGRVVTQIEGDERRVSGAFGSLDLGLRTIGVDLAGERIAGTTGDGRVLVAARSRVTGTAPDEDDTVEVYSGGDRLLPPAWDLHGQLWLVDDAPGGAEVYVVRNGVARRVEVDGVTGADVRSFVLSRDGTRFVAVLDRRGGDVVRIARVESQPSGRVRGLTPSQRLDVSDLGIFRIRDIGWRSPASLAVLTAPTRTTSQVLIVKIDGSSTPEESTSDAEVFRSRTREVVTAPVLSAPLYLRTPGGVFYALAATGRWTGAGIEPGLRSPTFVG
jgi:hypothetical protein